MKYAVITSGGKQYKVTEGQFLKLEKLDVEQNHSIEFDKILMVSDGDKVKIGEPYVKGCIVKAEVVSHGRGEKMMIIKLKRRKHHMKRLGHRQSYTQIRITGIAA
jgi:large subunit ribosomal protein L21